MAQARNPNFPMLTNGGKMPGAGKRRIKHEARRMAAMIVDSKGYRRSLMQRAHAGTLPPAVEVMLWHYRYGRPVKKIEMDVNDQRLSTQLMNMTSEELAARALEVHAEILEAERIAKETERREAVLRAEEALAAADAPDSVM